MRQSTSGEMFLKLVQVNTGLPVGIPPADLNLFLGLAVSKQGGTSARGMIRFIKGLLCKQQL